MFSDEEIALAHELVSDGLRRGVPIDPKAIQIALAYGSQEWSPTEAASFSAYVVARNEELKAKEAIEKTAEVAYVAAATLPRRKQWESKPDSMGITYGKIGCQFHIAVDADSSDLEGYECSCTRTDTLPIGTQVKEAQERVSLAASTDGSVAVGDVLLAGKVDSRWWHYAYGLKPERILRWTEEAVIAKRYGYGDDYLLNADVVIVGVSGYRLPVAFNVSRYMRNQWAVISNHGFAIGAAVGLGIVHFVF